MLVEILQLAVRRKSAANPERDRVMRAGNKRNEILALGSNAKETGRVSLLPFRLLKGDSSDLGATLRAPVAVMTRTMHMAPLTSTNRSKFLISVI